jgi:hypothetical protein
VHAALGPSKLVGFSCCCVLWQAGATCYDERLAVQRDAEAPTDGGVHIRHDRHVIELDDGCGARQGLQSNHTLLSMILYTPLLQEWRATVGYVRACSSRCWRLEHIASTHSLGDC